MLTHRTIANALGRTIFQDQYRFWAKVDARSELGCWLWTGAKTQAGYGVFTIGRDRTCYAHRWAYEYCIAPILSGLTIDHLCAVRACVNPWHMEPVEQSENSRRAIRRAYERRQSARAFCPHCPHCTGSS